MNDTDRLVRAGVYSLFRSGVRRVDHGRLAREVKLDVDSVGESLSRLVEEHRLVLTDEGSVHMAHPFSGVDTGHTATVGGMTYWANCAWDALAILALLGDGSASCPNGPRWDVEDGVVSPAGFVHLVIPAAQFWDDVVFT